LYCPCCFVFVIAYNCYDNISHILIKYIMIIPKLLTNNVLGYAYDQSTGQCTTQPLLHTEILAKPSQNRTLWSQIPSRKWVKNNRIFFNFMIICFELCFEHSSMCESEFWMIRRTVYAIVVHDGWLGTFRCFWLDVTILSLLKY